MRRQYPRISPRSVIFLALLLSMGLSHAQDFSDVERQRIAFTAQRGFEQIVQLWKDKRFEDLYTFGTFASQAELSPEAFEQYMRHATRTLQCCWATLQDVTSRFETVDRIYIKGRFGFRNKEFLVVRDRERFVARAFLEEETLTFLVQREEERWRVDLFRILALSGTPLEIPGAPFFLHRHY